MVITDCTAADNNSVSFDSFYDFVPLYELKLNSSFNYQFIGRNTN